MKAKAAELAENDASSGDQKQLLEEALRLLEEDRRMCRSIGEYGLPLLAGKKAILTHCNAGGLATSEYGTALAPVYVAAEQGRTIHVYADETRPLLQGRASPLSSFSRQGSRSP